MLRVLRPALWPVGFFRGRRVRGLQELNHADAVESHSAALISRDFEFQLRLSLRRGSLPDAFVPDAHEAPDEGGLVCWVDLYRPADVVCGWFSGADIHEACPLSV
jgi:hypothetical protein